MLNSFTFVTYVYINLEEVELYPPTVGPIGACKHQSPDAQMTLDIYKFPQNAILHV
jgi:hypothetical protein